MSEKVNLTVMMLFFVFFISGCESKKQLKYIQNTTETISTSNLSDRLDDIEKMEQCRRELDALKKIDGVKYNKRKQEFDSLVSGASLYSGIRADIGNYTQSAVDALYRFRSDKLCADISNDVLNGLVKEKGK